jgi:hypothetical protein
MKHFSARLAFFFVVAPFIVVAGAQNATPRINPAPSGPANPQNGSPVGTTPATPARAAASYNSSMSARDIQAYEAGRATCDRQVPGKQRDQCYAALSTRYPNVDAKCQKVSGSALDDCLKGADHAQ